MISVLLFWYCIDVWQGPRKTRSERVLTLSHSSQARPAPNPRPTNAGHARRLKRSTEKTTPNETPRPERMSMEDRQRSHCVDAGQPSCVQACIVKCSVKVLSHEYMCRIHGNAAFTGQWRACRTPLCEIAWSHLAIGVSDKA